MTRHMPSAAELLVSLARENERQRIMIEQLEAEIDKLRKQLSEALRDPSASES